MTDPNEKNLDAESTVTRRAFGKAAAGTTLFAAAAEPAVADDLRGSERVSEMAATGERTIPESFTPGDWLTVGPFQYQRRDTEVGWLFPEGGADAVGSGASTPAAGDELPSAFAAGSSVEWRRQSALGTTVPFPQAAAEIDPTGGDVMGLFAEPGLLDDFQDWYGLGGVLYGIGYGFTTFEMDAPRRAMLETDSTVWLNGRKYEEAPTGVVLQEGTNYLLAKQYLILGQFGTIDLEFRPPEAPVEVDELAAFRGTPQNAIVPDLRVGEDDTDLPASVRVTNTTSETIDAATLTFAPESDVVNEQEVAIDPPLAPFETRRVNTRVQLPGATGDAGGSGGSQSVPPSERAAEQATENTDSETLPAQALANTKSAEAMNRSGSEEEYANSTSAETVTLNLYDTTITVTARVTASGATHARDVPIRVRGADEPRRQSTFTSRHDDSVQTFAFRKPSNYDTGSGPWELIVSLHGANVPAINQAGANNSREDAFVVAPAARGPVNYDHEDLGRLDDLEAMDVMTERYDIDDAAVYLSGHSMGGHGTWHVGLTHSGTFASLGPSAAWTDHETYITTTWGRDKIHTDPRLKAVKETSLQKNLAMPKAANAADGNTPVFTLNGADDQAVPPMMPRSYIRALANEGLTVDGQVDTRHSNPNPDEVDAAYLEVPGAGHWWDKGIGPGNDGVNHPDMWSYLRANRNDPYPERLTFFTTNLRVEHEKQWVRVLEQETVHAPTRVDARVTADGIEMTTENVAKLELDTRVLTETDGRSSRRVTVDGEAASLPSAERAVVDVRDGIQTGRSSGTEAGTKGPDQYGPLTEVHHSPYLLVYGTQGDAEETAANRNLANVRSQRLVSRARAPAPVVPDTAVSRTDHEEYNLVLFGRPSSNAVYDSLRGAFPIDVGDGEVRLGGETYVGDLGVEFVYPNPRSDRLVQVSTGSTLRGARLTRARNWIPTQTATADYHVFDDSVRYQKWNASVAAGFFDKNWTLTPERGVFREIDHER
ncbi:MAG: prolyl oligopeptidase family serine peptidase [Halolamina sp.]